MAQLLSVFMEVCLGSVRSVPVYLYICRNPHYWSNSDSASRCTAIRRPRANISPIRNPSQRQSGPLHRRAAGAREIFEFDKMLPLTTLQPLLSCGSVISSSLNQIC